MAMRLTNILRLHLPDFAPRATKLHFAQSNGREDPLDVFYAGDFPLWQSSQTQRNFQRDLVLALIQTRRRDRWLFAGLWRRIGDPAHGPDSWSLAHGLAPDALIARESWWKEALGPRAHGLNLN